MRLNKRVLLGLVVAVLVGAAVAWLVVWRRRAAASGVRDPSAVVAF